MISNRSVPTDTVLPHIVYRDVGEAIAWLTRTFGFSEHYRYGGTQSLTIFVEDIQAHFGRAKAAGAKLVEDLHETVYGELQYAAEDLAGHHWIFSRHAQDLSPEQWGAAIAEELPDRLEALPRPRFCYLEIPAIDVKQSVGFYEHVFGWNIRHRDTERPSFDDATGNVSGAWVAGRDSSPKPGLLPYVWVDNIETTLKLITAEGGEIVDAPHPDSPGGSSRIATFRDPAGNLLGLSQ